MEDKWKILIEAAKKYYVDNESTGFLDFEYDDLERRALEEDNFSVRDYIFNTYFPKGSRYKNSYVKKFKKEKISDDKTMLSRIKELGSGYYYDLKLDGTSLMIYLDPLSGKPLRTVTCGNTSLGEGIDQTWKIIGLGLLPSEFPKGLVAIQCECVIDLLRVNGEFEVSKARQRINGLVNSKNQELYSDIKKFFTMRAYRYWCSDDPIGISMSQMDYRDVIKSLPIHYIDEPDRHITFAPIDVFTLSELLENPGYCETDQTITSSGEFLNDGWICYTKSGEVEIGLKFPGAGSGDAIVTSNVSEIKWTSQVSKGKDSWSANVILDPPINLHGSIIKKPSAGSVSKLISKNISVGSKVSIVLANSTIPMVDECFGGGTGNFMWPKCSCGYCMSSTDVYGSNLKCGNKQCTERIGRMKNYINSLSDIHRDLDLNKFLVIDRFDFSKSGISIDKLLEFVEKSDPSGYKDYLMSFMNTDLRKKNLELVWEASYLVLEKKYREG